MSSLAIDGGQTALRLRVLPDGRTSAGPGYRHGADSRAATVAAIRQALAAVRFDGPIDTVALGLTGFPPDPVAALALARDLKVSLQAREVRLTQDVVTTHAGALPDGYGVVVAAGTGLVCLGIGPDGTRRKIDGHGYLFGDAGSAFAIGRAGLVAVQRARDGRGPATALADLELDPVSLYPSPTLVADVAAFAPEVFRHAPADAVAQAIVDQAARDIADTIHAALPGPAVVPVALVGGLFEGAGEQLLEPLRAALSSRAQLTPAAGNSLDGAERLATGPLTPYDDLVVVHR
ncbi:N-acetylglucosamine kinase [Kribbella sp. DT2]|uniref:N-acetylglucosamine kinase n=1 Tax=Kribbella sp. DT2 TaxID=3393427 RepID=UPI003CE88394